MSTPAAPPPSWCSECRIVVAHAVDECCPACGTDVLEGREGYPRSFAKAISQGRYNRAAWLEARHADRWLGRLCDQARGPS